MEPLASLPNGGNSNGDRISALPDCVLGSILFLLPLKEAGRTTILSKRWQGVFAQSPIDLDDRELGRHLLDSGVKEEVLRADRVSAITQILAAHKGPIRRVRLEVSQFQGDVDGQEGIDPMAFTTRGVEELIIHSTVYPIQFFPAPPLRSIQLLSCDDWFYPEPPPSAIFAHIKELSLCVVNITEDEVHTLMEQCIVLESLQLCSYHIDGVDSIAWVELDITKLEIQSQSLRRLDLDIRGMKQVVIVDAPNLDGLFGGFRYGSYCRATIINAPKLRFIGYLSVTDNIHPSQAPAIGFNLELSGPIHSVKMMVLCLDLSFISQVNNMLQMLKCFPGLVMLYIEIHSHKNETHELQSEAAYAASVELAKSVDCLRGSVKAIFIGNNLLLSSTCCTQKLGRLLRENAKKPEDITVFSVNLSTRRYRPI